MAAEGGVLWPVARALIALIGVSALAWVALLWLAKRGVPGALPWSRWLGSATAQASRLQLLERLALGPRQRLYLVRADSRVFLLGAAEGGGLSLIAELTDSPPKPGA